MLTRDRHVRVMLEKCLQMIRIQIGKTLGSVGKDLPKQNAKSLGHLRLIGVTIIHLKTLNHDKCNKKTSNICKKTTIKSI